MGLFGGIIGKIIGVAVLLVVLVVAIAGFAYATDARTDATVTEKNCAASTVTVKTKVGGITHIVKDLPAQQCAIIQAGNFVQYYLRSQRTTIFESEGGSCIWDTQTGPACGPAAIGL